MAGITVQVIGKQAVLDAMRAAGADMGELLTAVMEMEMQKTADVSRTTKFSGSPLNRRTGNLSRNINGDATIAGSQITGRIGVDLDAVPYGYVHEVGGTFDIPEHTRRTGMNARLERIRMLNRSGDVRAAVKAMSRGVVRAHTATYPQRSFLRPVMNDRRTEIFAALSKAATRIVRES